MKVIVELKGLKSALNALRVARARDGAIVNSPTPFVGDCVRLEANREEGTIVVSRANLQVHIARRVPAHIQRAGAVVVDYELLSSLVKNLPGGTGAEVELEGVENALQYLSIGCQGVGATLPLLDPELVPTVNSEGVLATYTEGNTFRQAIAACAPAAAKDRTRPVLTYLDVWVKWGVGLWAVGGADGYRAAMWHYERARAEPTDQDIARSLLPARPAAEVAAQLSNTREPVELSVLEDGRFRLGWGHGWAVFTPDEGAFPNLHTVIPQHPPIWVNAPRAMLLSVLALLKPTAEAVGGTLWLCSSAGRPFLLKVVKGGETITETGVSGEVLRRGDVADLIVGVQIEYLIDALEVSKSPRVHIGLTGPTAAILLTFEPEYYAAVIQPMYIKGVSDAK